MSQLKNVLQIEEACNLILSVCIRHQNFPAKIELTGAIQLRCFLIVRTLFVSKWSRIGVFYYLEIAYAKYLIEPFYGSLAH